MVMEIRKGLLITTRTHNLDDERARDEGTRHAMVPDAGAPYTVEMADEMIKHLVERGFREDLLITVHPVGLTPQNLARRVSRLLGYYRERWGKRHAVGPDREPVWFDFLVVAALTGDQHQSHAHVVLDVDLDGAEVRKLEARAAKWDIPLVVTRNRDNWLEDKPMVSGHRCRVDYTIGHMLRAGAVLEIGETDRVPFVPRVRANYLQNSGRAPSKES